MDDTGNEPGELSLEPVTVVRTRRPRALWAVLAAVGLAAGALVVTSAGDDGTSRPGLPVALGSAAGGGEGAMAADSRLAWVTYVAGDGLPALGGAAPAYRLGGAVDEARVRALADALGVTGDVAHDGDVWKVGNGDATLEVFEGGGGQWWFSAAGRGGDIAVGSGSSSGSVGSEGDTACAEAPADCVESTLPCPPGTQCVDPVPPEPQDIECTKDDGCAEPVPMPPIDVALTGLGSEDEARTIALDLLAATGVDVDGAIVTVDGPHDAWYITVETLVEGVPSGLLANVAVGSEGKVANASGYLGAPDPLGDYPQLDTRAVIDRANSQMRDGGLLPAGPAVDASTGVASASAGDDPCAPPEGASDGCGTTTGGSVGEPTTTTIAPCKVQPDGRDICEYEGCVNTAGDDAMDRVYSCEVPTCPQAAPPADEPIAAPETINCTPPIPEPVPEPEPLEIVLVDAEPTLIMLSANDGSTDAYLVPGYRFTDADGGRVDLPAVADDSLTTPETTETLVPETPILPDPGGKPPVDPQPCGPPLVEEDASGTTHTVQPDPDCVGPDPVTLEEGEEPVVGVGYYVDVLPIVHCNWISVELGGQWWWADGIPTDEITEWSQPTEGGTLTLSDESHAEFVGDAQRTKVAELVPFPVQGEVDRPLCD